MIFGMLDYQRIRGEVEVVGPKDAVRLWFYSILSVSQAVIRTRWWHIITSPVGLLMARDPSICGARQIAFVRALSLCPAGGMNEMSI